MAEDRVDVRFGAQTGELSAGFKEALGIINEGLGGITSSIGLATNAFFGFQIGREILEKVGEAIERVTIDVAEFDEKIEILAKKIGTSTEEATILDTALKNVGVSTDLYTAVLFKLERQVATNEGRLRALGIVTRDHNGQLLQGDDLMRSAIARMQEFRAGTDQNAFALTAFGRGAQEVYQIMRLTPQALADARAEVDKFGAVSEEQAANALKFKESVNKLHTEWDLFVTKIGNIILPALTSILDWVSTIPDKINTLVSAFANLFPFLNMVRQTADALSAASTTINKGSGIGDAAANALNTGGGGLGGAAGGAFSTGKGGLQFVDPGAADKAQKEFDKWLKDLEADLKKASDLKKAAQISDIGIARDESLTKIDLEREQINRMAALGQISEEEKLQRLRDLSEREYQIELQSLQAILQLHALKAQEIERVDQQIVALKRKHALEIAKIETDQAKQSLQSWKNILAPIQQTITQSVMGILQGTQTVMGAVRNLLTGLLSSLVDFGAKWIGEWLINQLFAQTTASVTSVTTSIGQIMNSAAVAAANAFASTAAIPYVGLALAPGAAAAAYGETSAFAAAVTPFEIGAWEIPRDMLGYLHQGETVVPKSFAEGARDGGGFGGPALHYYAPRGVSYSDLKRDARNMARLLAEQMRNFNPHLKPT